jgi:hypothetical protein
MPKFDDSAVQEYDECIASALRTEGGHLSIGSGNFTLYYASGARLSGYDCGRVKACCIESAAQTDAGAATEPLPAFLADEGDGADEQAASDPEEAQSPAVAAE